MPQVSCVGNAFVNEPNGLAKDAVVKKERTLRPVAISVAVYTMPDALQRNGRVIIADEFLLTTKTSKRPNIRVRKGSKL